MRDFYDELFMPLVVVAALFLMLVFITRPVSGRSAEADHMFAALAEIRAHGAVYIHDPENPLWKGRASYVEKRVGDIVAVARKEGIFPPNVLPIKIGVVHFLIPNAMAEMRPGSRIVIDTSFFDVLPGEEWIDVILAHEVGHVYSYREGDNPHSNTWYAMCVRLYAGITTGPGHPRACKVSLR